LEFLIIHKNVCQILGFLNHFLGSEIIPKKKLRKKKEKEDKESIPDQLQLLYFEDVNGLLIIR
jgi:hypothetical protein